MRAVRITGGIALALFAGLAWFLSPLEPGVLALQLAFTPQSFARIVHAWPPEHLLRYRAHLPIDGLLLVAYGAFGYLVSTRTALLRGAAGGVRLGARWGARWWLPLAAAFDAVEDGLHWWLTAEPRFGMPLPYAVSGICSVLKLALLFAFGALVVRALASAES